MAIVSSGSGRTPQRRETVLVDPQPSTDEERVRPEDSLRPKRLDEYIGQSALKQVLGIAVQAALGRGEALDHVLLYGCRVEMALGCLLPSSVATPVSRGWISMPSEPWPVCWSADGRPMG